MPDAQTEALQGSHGCIPARNPLKGRIEFDQQQPKSQPRATQRMAMRVGGASENKRWRLKPHATSGKRGGTARPPSTHPIHGDAERAKSAISYRIPGAQDRHGRQYARQRTHADAVVEIHRVAHLRYLLRERRRRYCVRIGRLRAVQEVAAAHDNIRRLRQ